MVIIIDALLVKSVFVVSVFGFVVSVFGFVVIVFAVAVLNSIQD